MAEHHAPVMPIAKLARHNDKFRDVIWTGDKTQLVLMAIPEGKEIGGETHAGHDQMLYFVDGMGRATIGKTEMDISAGDVAIVPSGTYHNFQNVGSGMLRLFTTYSPPEHAPGTEHGTKADQEADPAAA
ncbi:MAG: cupin domain-containing protein [Marivita sp.]|uniref:cupin domain-containing protein n=1 Tax=Marivita sp. TaxID=2003365 RepID=UPI003EF4E383